ncbi:MAG TPA: sugar transferase [Candidatus Acidoferrum sp.]|nr:sugar transferase [Candidatus Acidoferrum sp.]
MSGTATQPSRAPAAATAAALPLPSPEFRPPISEAYPERAERVSNLDQLALQVCYAAVDLALVCAGGVLVFWMRFDLANPFGNSAFSPEHLSLQAWSSGYPGFLLLYAGLVVLACMSQDLYSVSRDRSASAEIAGTLKSVGIATALLVLFIFTSGNKEISRLVVACSAIWNAGALSSWRLAKRRYVLRRARRGEGVSRVLILGSGRLGRALGHWLRTNPQMGYELCGFLDVHPGGGEGVLGSVRDLRRVALEQFADRVFVTLPTDRELVKEVFLEARRMHINLNVVPDLYDGLAWRAPLERIGGFPVIELHREPIPMVGLAVKRAIDVLGAAALLSLSAPLLLLAAVWICCDSPGPVLYSAMRVGKKGRKFLCYKLRTMVVEADAQKERLRRANERDGPFFKIENDPRITRCGRWLRKFSVDEIPQLFNVLLGNMSLVGPRPHPVDDFERYTIEHLRRLDVKPGVTGLWQVKARRDPSFDTNMILDLEYIENWSLWLDVAILMRTLRVVLDGEGR